MANNIEALKSLDLQEFNEACDKESNLFEEKFLALFKNDEENKAVGPKCPVFDFAPQM